MAIALRVLLIVASVFTVMYMLRKIRKAHMNIEDSLFWIFFSIVIILLAIFTPVATMFAKLFGIESPANFVFLSVIFVLLITQFLTTVKISKLENKIKTLTQKVAISENERQKGNELTAVTIEESK